MKEWSMRLTSLILFILFLNSCAIEQELTLGDVLYVDLLELKSESKALEIQEKLWQVGVEAEVQEGYLEKEQRYYIEIQDLSILDIEIQQGDEWVRWFDEKIKKKLIKVEFEI